MATVLERIEMTKLKMFARARAEREKIALLRRRIEDTPIFAERYKREIADLEDIATECESIALLADQRDSCHRPHPASCDGHAPRPSDRGCSRRRAGRLVIGPGCGPRRVGGRTTAPGTSQSTTLGAVLTIGQAPGKPSPAACRGESKARSSFERPGPNRPVRW